MGELQLVNKNKEKDWRLLEFFMPIEEKAKNNVGEFVIRGVAINETTTLNNVKYVSEELLKAASSFRNVPILLDHKNEVKNIVGRTTENVDFNSAFNRIEYEAKIMDKDIKEMIEDGRIQNVSIGAKVEDLKEEKDGSMKAVGIHGLEISIVAVPGDNQASLAQAIQNNFHLKEMAMSKVVNEQDNQLNKEDSNMAEDEVKAPEEEKKEEEKKEEEKKEEKKEEVKEEKVQTTDLSEMKAQISELKELLQAKKKVTEQIEEEKKEEVKEEPKEDKTKGEVSSKSEEKLKEIDSTIVEKARLGYSIYKDYSTEGADTKLKRLVR